MKRRGSSIQNYKTKKSKIQEEVVCNQTTNTDSASAACHSTNVQGSLEKEVNYLNNTLPEEMLLAIFSKLDHSDRLNARRVCRTWNTALSNWCDFTSTSCFSALRRPTYNSFGVLRSSVVPWKYIRIGLKDSSTFKFSTWYFPKHLYRTLTTLHIMEGTITLTWLSEVANRFETLKKINLQLCEIERPNADSAVSLTSKMAPKRKICLKLVALDFPSLLSYLRAINRSFELNEALFSLAQLKIDIPEIDNVQNVITRKGWKILKRFTRKVWNLCIWSKSTLQEVTLKAGGAEDATFKYTHIMEDNELNQEPKIVNIRKVSIFANSLDAIVHKCGDRESGKYFLPYTVKKGGFTIPLLIPPRTVIP